MSDARQQAATADAGPTIPELSRVFGRIGILSFGGPAAQIALMQTALVDERRWMTEAQFLSALSFCMLLPGPEAMQLATYAGWRVRGVLGGLISGLLFVLPGAAVVIGLTLAYAYLGDIPAVDAAFRGIQAAVVVIVLVALWRLSRRALRGAGDVALALAAFAALFLFAVPFPAVIAVAAAIGAIRGGGEAPDTGAPPVALATTARTVALWMAVWLVPLGAIALAGPQILGQMGAFFAKLAVVTFGGAYAVLAYMTQEVVNDYGWLTTQQMIDGLGLAETTPGPLILVTVFVGLLAALFQGGLTLGLAGAVVTLWATFAPCFLWIFAGAPYVEWLRGRPRLTGALAAITAAVVGVILNLSLWFAIHVFFGETTDVTAGPLDVTLPVLPTLQPGVALLAGLAAALWLAAGLNLIPALGLTALAAIGLQAVS